MDTVVYEFYEAINTARELREKALTALREQERKFYPVYKAEGERIEALEADGTITEEDYDHWNEVSEQMDEIWDSEMEIENCVL